MADLQHLVEELSKLTVLEAAELSKKLSLAAHALSTGCVEAVGLDEREGHLALEHGVVGEPLAVSRASFSELSLAL